MSPRPDDRQQSHRGRLSSLDPRRLDLRRLDPRLWDQASRRLTAVLGVIVLCSLFARVIALGDRPFHWDEARVGYWALRSLETGSYDYRPVAGGPVVVHLTRIALATAPATDALARLPFAIAGGLLPAVALAFRGRLRTGETIATAFVLAFAPPLVYYGRFLRGDVIAAGAALLGVGFLLRWLETTDTRTAGDGSGATTEPYDRYLYGGVVAWAVALGASGFAVATLVIVLVAALVTLDRSRVADRPTTLGASVSRGWDWTITQAPSLARAAFVFLAVWGVLFAPRGAESSGSGAPGGINGLLADPIGMAERTYIDPVTAFIGVRVEGRAGTQFLPFVTDALSTSVATAAPIVGIAVAGFLADRYGLLRVPLREPVTGETTTDETTISPIPGGRPLVLFASVWAGLGLVGYPVVAEVIAPWTLVHVLVPLAVPAGVGIAAVYRYGKRAVNRTVRTGDREKTVDTRHRTATPEASPTPQNGTTEATSTTETTFTTGTIPGDAARVAAAGLVLAALVVSGGIVTLDHMATDPSSESALAQYGQPADDLEPLVRSIDTALETASPEDTRVVWVGDRYHLSSESVADRPPITAESDRAAWGERLPLPWYLERSDAETESVTTPSAIDGEPAVIIADPEYESSIDAMVPAHESQTLRLGLWNREVIVFLAT